MSQADKMKVSVGNQKPDITSEPIQYAETPDSYFCFSDAPSTPMAKQ